MPTNLPPRQPKEEPEWLKFLEALGVVALMYAQIWWTAYNVYTAYTHFFG